MTAADLPSALALAPLLLAAVLVWSAVFKFADADSTRSAIRQLRLPRTLDRQVVAVALPTGEIIVAAALLAPWSSVYAVAAAAAVLLFAAYLVLIARALTFDPRPSCGCFGKMGGSRVAPTTLVRNILLFAVALVAGASAPAGGTAWSVLGKGTAWWLLAAAVAAAVTALIVARPAGSDVHGVTPPTPGPPATDMSYPGGDPAADRAADDGPADYLRSPIPAATLQRADGSMCTLTELAARRAQVLIAVNCTCGPTVGAARRLPAWREAAPAIDVRFVATIAPPSIHQITDVDEIFYDHGAIAWHALGIESSPAAVLLGADGQLAGGPVHGLDAIEEFLTDIAAALAEAGAPAEADTHAGAPAGVTASARTTAPAGAGA